MIEYQQTLIIFMIIAFIPILGMIIISIIYSIRNIGDNNMEEDDEGWEAVDAPICCNKGMNLKCTEDGYSTMFFQCVACKKVKRETY